MEFPRASCIHFDITVILASVSMRKVSSCLFALIHIFRQLSSVVLRKALPISSDDTSLFCTHM